MDLQNTPFVMHIGTTDLDYRGGCWYQESSFGALGGDIQGGGKQDAAISWILETAKLRSHSLVAPRRGLADIRLPIIPQFGDKSEG